MKIKAWSLCVVWDDGSEQAISDIPHHVAVEVDEFLDTLEEAAPEGDE